MQFSDHASPEFILRPWRESDLQDVVQFANNPRIARNLTDAFPHPYTEEDGKAFIARFSNDSPCRVFAIEIGGRACGSVGVFPQEDVHRKNAELGYWLAEPYWGRGIMTRVVRQVVDYAFQTFDITRIFARPYGSNPASRRVLEKAGFTLEAYYDKTIFKNGEFLDELILAIRR